MPQHPDAFLSDPCRRGAHARCLSLSADASRLCACSHPSCLHRGRGRKEHAYPDAAREQWLAVEGARARAKDGVRVAFTAGDVKVLRAAEPLDRVQHRGREWRLHLDTVETPVGPALVGKPLPWNQAARLRTRSQSGRPDAGAPAEGLSERVVRADGRSLNGLD